MSPSGGQYLLLKWEAFYFGGFGWGRSSPLSGGGRDLCKSFTNHCHEWSCFDFHVFQVMTTNAILPVYHPVLHQSWARKRMVPLTHTHLGDANWYLTISWQLSLQAKEDKPEFTKTKYVPLFAKVKRSQHILSRDVHQRRNLRVWGCLSKKVRSFTAAVRAAFKRGWETQMKPIGSSQSPLLYLIVLSCLAQALATSKQSWSWIQLSPIGCLPGKRRWMSSGISWGSTSVGKKLEVFIFLVLLGLEKLPA